MSDFESGLATKVRLLPGELHSTSEVVSTSNGTSDQGAKCAQSGAHPVAGTPELAKGSSPFASSTLTCDDAHDAPANTRETHKRTFTLLWVLALAALLVVTYGMHQRANAQPVDPTWQQSVVTIDDEAAVAAAQAWGAPFRVEFKEYGADIHVKPMLSDGTVVGGEATKTTNGGRITGCAIVIKDGTSAAALTHEVGHCFGLHHRNEDSHSIMYFVQGSASGSPVVTDADRAALAALYEGSK